MTAIAIEAERYVRISLFAALTGLTVEAINQKIKNGDWLEGHQYIRRGREIYVDRKGYRKWVEQGQVTSS